MPTRGQPVIAQRTGIHTTHIIHPSFVFSIYIPVLKHTESVLTCRERHNQDALYSLNDLFRRLVAKLV